MPCLTRIEAKLWIQRANYWALVGASPKPGRYAYQLFQALRLMGKTVIPVNPSYPNIDGIECRPSLDDLSIKPEILVFVMGPARTLEMLKTIPKDGCCHLWFPPECSDESVLQALEGTKYSYVADLCPIGLGMEAGLLKAKP